MAWSCGEPEPSPIDVTDPGELDAVALVLEDRVAVGNVAAIRREWLSSRELEGCQREGSELPDAQTRAFIAEHAEAFEDRAALTLSIEWAGKLAFTSTRQSKPALMGSALGGERCPADRFGRVFVYVRRTSPPRLVEHAFNLLRVDGQWRVYRYFARRVRCDRAPWRDGRVCRHLHER